MRGGRRAGAALGMAGLVLAASSWSGASGAPAAAPARASAGACADRTGITVVVDQTAFGGAVEVRCAAQPVRSGFEALTKAGFTYSGTVRFPGLLCRIDGQPAADPCQGAPPPDAYWAYWHAERGGAWAYSTAGAGRTPPPGSVEGWAFGDEAEPGVAPPLPPPAPVSPTTTSPVASAPADPPVTSPAGSEPPADGPGGGPSDGGAAPPDRGGESSSPSARQPIPASGVRDGDAGGQGAATAMVASMGERAPEAGGSPLGTLVTVGALAGAGLLVVRFRRDRLDG